MASRWRTWDYDFKNEVLQSAPCAHLECTAVNHSLRREELRARAKQVVLPKFAVDSNQCHSCIEKFHVHEVQKVGVAMARMGGVKRGGIEMIVKPKVSGRARALKMRAQQLMVQQRRPGQLLRKHSDGRAMVSNGTSNGWSESSTESGVTSRRPFFEELKERERKEEEKMRLEESVFTWDQSDKHWPALGPPPTDPNDTTAPCESSDTSEDTSESREGTPLSSQIFSTTQSVASMSCGDMPDWPIDENTLCFQNVPRTFTPTELEQYIESFGEITHCTMMTRLNEAGLTTAYVRMGERSACKWVISCFHGNPLADSPAAVELAVYYAKCPADSQ